MKKLSLVEIGIAGILMAALVLGLSSLIAQEAGLRTSPPVLIVKNGPPEGETRIVSSNARLKGRVGDIEILSILIPTNQTITNVDLKAYFAKVTNVSGVLRVATLGLAPAESFETNNPDFFQGNQIWETTNGWNVVPFKMSSNYFGGNGTNGVTDKLLLILVFETESGLPYQCGALYSIDSPADGWVWP